MWYLPSDITLFQRNLSTKIEELPIDSATGSLFPYYDPDLNLMYIAGKVTYSTPYRITIASCYTSLHDTLH